MADSCWGLAENRRILQNNYPSIKYNLKKTQKTESQTIISEQRYSGDIVHISLLHILECYSCIPEAQGFIFYGLLNNLSQLYI